MNKAQQIANGMQIFAKYTHDIFTEKLGNGLFGEHIVVVLNQAVEESDIVVLKENQWYKDVLRRDVNFWIFGL